MTECVPRDPAPTTKIPLTEGFHFGLLALLFQSPPASKH
jgi:hypothetical protein